VHRAWDYHLTAMASLGVDLSPLLRPSSFESNQAQSASVEGLLQAASNHGYAHASGHGVPAEVTSRLLTCARDFFDRASPEERARVALHENPGGYRGYQPVRANVTQGQPDGHQALDYMRTLVGFESSCLGPEIVEMVRKDNVYPSTEMEDAVHDFVRYAVPAGVAVMRAVALGLGLCASAFEENGAFSDPFWIIRLIHYPSVESDHGSAVTKGSGGDGCSNVPELGCGAHRDYGFVTFVVAETNPPDAVDTALQVWRNETSWISAVKPPKGDLFINFGDCLEVVSSGVFPATLHRVMRPGVGDRLSVAVFIEPNFDWKIRSAVSLGSTDSCDDDSSVPVPEGGETQSYSSRIRRLQSFKCYGEYLYSKVSSNFDSVSLKAI
jgi:isopenicillin N synthase-like dioxygenase